MSGQGLVGVRANLIQQGVSTRGLEQENRAKGNHLEIEQLSVKFLQFAIDVLLVFSHIPLICTAQLGPPPTQPPKSVKLRLSVSSVNPLLVRKMPSKLL